MIELPWQRIEAVAGNQHKMDLRWLFGDSSLQGEDDSVMSDVRSSDEVEFAVEDRQYDVEVNVSPVVDGSNTSTNMSAAEDAVAGVGPAFSESELRIRLEEVLARLADPLHSLPDEVRISEKLLSFCSSDVVTEFLQYCCLHLTSCVVNVTKKFQNPSEDVITEKNFREFRVDCESCNVWLQVLDVCNVEPCQAASCCIQHILQHFWTTVSCAQSMSQHLSPNTCREIPGVHDDSLEVAGLLNHAGWCIKRARDAIKAMPSVTSVRVGKEGAETIADLPDRDS